MARQGSQLPLLVLIAGDIGKAEPVSPLDELTPGARYRAGGFNGPVAAPHHHSIGQSGQGLDILPPPRREIKRVEIGGQPGLLLR